MTSGQPLSLVINQMKIKGHWQELENHPLKFEEEQVILAHCNGVCQFGLVYSVLGTFIITLVLMISIALPHTPNKIHAAT